MSDDAALLAAICAAPDDDAPRLVYADWLDEHGHPDRAEFIRVQCERARRPCPALHEREDRLWNAHHDKLAGPLAAPGVRYLFHRGFAFRFGHTGVFLCMGRGDTNALLRFFPDGTALSVLTVGGTPDQVTRWFRRDHDLSSRGTYHLDPLVTPARIRFSTASSEGTVSYRGEFRGAALDLHVYSRVTSRRNRQEFTHHHLPGFDSFADI
jgi:uncharacterized protein (TIGR02996 family)